MKKLALFVILSMLTVSVMSQSMVDPIQTDRPDQTESPSTVPAGHWQFEAGTLFEQDKSGGITENNYLAPTLLTKYGVNDVFEFRLITELGINSTEINRRTNSTNGIKPVIIGMKVNICKENRKRFIPKTSLIGHLGLGGLASKNFETNYSYPQFRFLMQHTLTKKTSLSYNIGAELYGNTPELTGIYTLAVARDLGAGFGGFAEVYGYFPEQSDWDHRFDAGVTYLLNHNLQFDVSGGFGLTDNAPDYFLSAGVSFRTN